METAKIGSRSIFLSATEKPEFILIQASGEHEKDFLESEIQLIQAKISASFVFAAVPVSDWNRDLSPWPAPPVYGNEPFGDGAKETLSVLTEERLPELKKKYGNLPVILGGYSLAGLFALYAACESSVFSAVCACSPSMWFPRFSEYSQSHPLKTSYVYLSLGDREEKTKNPVMSSVGDRIREYKQHLDDIGFPSDLRWNEGNHFRHPEVRTADGFAACMLHLRKRNQEQ